MKNIDCTLYLVTDSSACRGSDFFSTVEAALKGGVTLLQLREKGMGGKDFYEEAKKIKGISDTYGVPLIINDRVDIALAVGAAGVHLGQSDLPVHAARKIMGGDKIIGASAKTVRQALKAESDGADYLGVGAIFPTTTKVVTKRTDISVLNDICNSVSIPVVAIGGINKTNIESFQYIPIDGVSVVSAIMKAENPLGAAKKLKELFLKMK